MSGVLFTFCCLFVLLQDGRALKGFKHWFTLAAHGTRGYHARVRCGSFGLAIFTDLFKTTVTTSTQTLNHHTVFSTGKIDLTKVNSGHSPVQWPTFGPLSSFILSFENCQQLDLDKGDHSSNLLVSNP